MDKDPIQITCCASRFIVANGRSIELDCDGSGEKVKVVLNACRASCRSCVSPGRVRSKGSGFTREIAQKIRDLLESEIRAL